MLNDQWIRNHPLNCAHVLLSQVIQCTPSLGCSSLFRGKRENQQGLNTSLWRSRKMTNFSYVVIVLEPFYSKPRYLPFKKKKLPRDMVVHITGKNETPKQNNCTKKETEPQRCGGRSGEWLQVCTPPTKWALYKMELVGHDSFSSLMICSLLQESHCSSSSIPS